MTVIGATAMFTIRQLIVCRFSAPSVVDSYFLTIDFIPFPCHEVFVTVTVIKNPFVSGVRRVVRYFIALYLSWIVISRNNDQEYAPLVNDDLSRKIIGRRHDSAGIVEIENNPFVSLLFPPQHYVYGMIGVRLLPPRQ